MDGRDMVSEAKLSGSRGQTRDKSRSKLSGLFSALITEDLLG